MSHKLQLLFLAFTACVVFPHQTLAACGAENTNPNCGVGAYPVDGGTVYYAPNDNSDIVLYAQAQGTCDSGTSGDVSLYSGAYPGVFLTDCGCLPLNGNVYTVDCAGYPRNQLAAGVYNFQVDLGVLGAYDQ